MSAATKIRATALPMPEVEEAGREAVGFQGAEHKRVKIGGSSFYVVKGGAVYQACGRCNGQGHISHYAGIYNGECFSCGRKGMVGFADSVEAAQRKVRSRQAATIRNEAKRAEAAAQAEAERPAREAAEREAAHGQALEEYARREAEIARKAASRQAGEIGEAVEVSGIVKVFMAVDGFTHGSPSQRLIVVEGEGDDAGISVKAYSSSAKIKEAGIERGQRVTIRGSVKRHSEYDGAAQTIITRVSIA